ncbi:hypothetical protein QTI66_13510 [Variovorax sp. J22R133]|uniref:hypothetical protein n=1 Tax=Variovorax brevis TaxID=3053503 RepID=UPI0025767F2D|nr:hypothetical protein [Variovorax sp. J22R133]MDM0113171.1 hypothetical protein [Variovorax sp. J22R133]
MILIKTEAGHLALKDRTVRLTPRQRSAFILFDGKRSVNDVLGAGMGIAMDDVEQMIELGLLGHVGGDGVAANSANVTTAATPVANVPVQPAQTAPAVEVAAAAPASARTPQQRYQEAYPIATKLTAGLGLRGFRLNLQVEGTSNYDELMALAPKIRAAVGEAKAAELDRSLAA